MRRERLPLRVSDALYADLHRLEAKMAADNREADELIDALTTDNLRLRDAQLRAWQITEEMGEHPTTDLLFDAWVRLRALLDLATYHVPHCLLGQVALHPICLTCGTALADEHAPCRCNDQA